MGDATKIYSGPITALGVADAETADAGSFTDLGLLDEESGAEINFNPYNAGLSDGNKIDKKGLGVGKFVLVQTDPAGTLLALETYETTLAKLKVSTGTAAEFYFIDNVFVHGVNVTRPFKPGEVHKFEFEVSRIADHADDFCDGPKAIA